jgi:hypothetical protein
MTTDTEAAAIIEAFARKIETDDRVVAAYVANDPPSETGDRCFDVKLVIACRRDSYDEFLSDIRSLVEGIDEVVWDSKPAFPRFSIPRELVTASGMQLEFYVYKAELGKWRMPVSRILKQTPGFFQPAIEERQMPSRRFVPSIGKDSATDTIERFWRILPHATHDLRSGELVFAHLVTLRMLSLLVTLLSERNRLPDNRTSRSYHLDPPDHAALMSAFSAAPQSREAIAHQQIALAQIMSTRGRAECESLGSAYPETLERVMRERLERELNELGICIE